MPASLRFVVALLMAATIGAAVAVFVVYRQEEQRVRVRAEQLTGGHVKAGRTAVARHGCGACHTITGIPGARGKVGPSLEGFGVATEVAGRLSNRPDHLVTWIRFPQSVAPGNGMPDQGIGETDARDIAAFLYTLTPDS